MREEHKRSKVQCSREVTLFSLDFFCKLWYQCILNISQDNPLSDEALSRLVSIISPQNLTSLAISHMGFKQPELATLDYESHRDSVRYMLEILIKWRNKHSAESDIRLVLQLYFVQLDSN